MNRRLWWVTVALMAGLVAFVAWLPGYRLEREIAAARAEGLWTTPEDVRRAVGPTGDGDNAAPLVRQACARTRGRSPSADASQAIGKVLKGTATPAETAKARAYALASADLAELWRAASRKSRLAFDRPWQDGAAVLFPEYADLKGGAKLLALEGRLGIRPRENLLAAARLSALVAQEPVLIADLVSVGMGRIALREARRQGMAREVEAALGPPIDARRTYAFEFFATYQTMRRMGTRGYDRRLFIGDRDEGLLDRLRHAGPWRDNAIRRYVARWRELWREMPRDGTDYAGMARALHRRMSAASEAAGAYDEVFTMLGGDPGEEDWAVKALVKYEAERAKARASG